MSDARRHAQLERPGAHRVRPTSSPWASTTSRATAPNADRELVDEARPGLGEPDLERVAVERAQAFDRVS